MSFQGTEKEEAKQRRTCPPPYSIVGEQREEPFVISSLGSFFDSFPQPGILSLFCKNCGVQCLLGRKVFEAQCLTAPAAFSIWFVVVPVKPFAANTDVTALIRLACRS
jgi:hypothetical protein